MSIGIYYHARIVPQAQAVCSSIMLAAPRYDIKEYVVVIYLSASAPRRLAIVTGPTRRSLVGLSCSINPG